MAEYMPNVIHVNWPLNSKISVKKNNKKLTTSDTETDHSEKATGSDSNLPVPTTNNVASQDIHKETSSDSETDQTDQNHTESLSENEDLQEPQTDLNAQLTSFDRIRMHTFSNLHLK